MKFYSAKKQIHAVWAKYPVGANLNQAAFAKYTERDTVTTFMTRFDPQFSTDLLNAVSAMGLAASREGTGRKPFDDAIADCVAAIDKIINDPY